MRNYLPLRSVSEAQLSLLYFRIIAHPVILLQGLQLVAKLSCPDRRSCRYTHSD